MLSEFDYSHSLTRWQLSLKSFSLEQDLKSIRHQTGLGEYIIGGSWASAQIVRILSEWDNSLEMRDFDKFELMASNIDIYHGVHEDDAPYLQ